MQRLERIVGAVPAPPVLLERSPRPVSRHHTEGIPSQESVACEGLPSFHRFEQEVVARSTAEREEGADRREEVRRDLPAQRHQVPFLSGAQELPFGQVERAGFQGAELLPTSKVITTASDSSGVLK